MLRVCVLFCEGRFLIRDVIKIFVYRTVQHWHQACRLLQLSLISCYTRQTGGSCLASSLLNFIFIPCLAPRFN